MTDAEMAEAQAEFAAHFDRLEAQREYGPDAGDDLTDDELATNYLTRPTEARNE